MQANPKFRNQSLEFWANVKLLNQRLGYVERSSVGQPESRFKIPSVEDIIHVFQEEGLDSSNLVYNNKFTDFGQEIIDYIIYRASVLLTQVKPNLMNQAEAKDLFYEYYKNLSPQCPLPMNKQKGEKREHAFLTGLVNMIIENNKGDFDCNYDPKELTTLTGNGLPIRVLSRRVDGAFPSVKDPIAIWEIKEYYYTKTFGSRVADGVYETQLDGWELREIKENLSREIEHYLIVDDFFTWWKCGRSYLCRLIDSIHMGLVTEVIFGREVIERIPILVDQWKNKIIQD